MPTIKTILFPLALLLLITPASASTSVYHESFSCQEAGYEGFSDSKYVYGSETHYLEGDISGYVIWKTEKLYGTPDNAYAHFGLQNVDTGTKYGLVTRQNVWGTWNSSLSISAMPAGNYRQYLYVYAYEYGDDARGMKATLLNETLVQDSTPEPEPPESSTVQFAYEEEKPGTWITVDYFIDGVESDYEEPYPGGTWEYDYEYSLLYSYIDPLSLITYETEYPVYNASGSHNYHIPVFSSDPWSVTVDLVETLTEINHWGSLSTVSNETATVKATDVLIVTSTANNTDPEEPEDPPEEPEDPVDGPIDIPDDPFNDPGTPENNETGEYNSTFLGGYYSTVDNMTGAFFNPVESSFTWLLYPVTTLNDSVGSTVVMVENSTVEVETYTPVVASVLNPLINSMPPKVQALITYNLLWVLVIMIFRRK